MNTLLIDGERIKLIGFEKLNTDVTFAFYPRGIVIFFEKQNVEDKPYYKNVTIKNNTINDKILLDKIKPRLKEGNTFLQSSNSYIQILK